MDLKSFREERGIAIVAAAREANVDPYVWRRVEGGEHGMTLLTAARIVAWSRGRVGFHDLLPAQEGDLATKLRNVTNERRQGRAKKGRSTRTAAAK